MESYSTTDILKKLQDKNISYFTLTDFGRLFNINNQNTIYKKIQRLEKTGLIKKLINGKYLFKFNQTNDFTTANFIYQPSYISLESALSFYAITTGFNYQITSLTIKKTRIFELDKKEFLYCHIGNNLFWGYEKKDNFLIAEKEKALLDYIYFFSKGLKSFDKTEFDLSKIDKIKLMKYQRQFNNPKLSSIIKKII